MPTALITGASSGIGRAIAIRLAAKGYQLALIARTKAPLNAVAKECRQAGAPAALAIPADVSNSEQLTHAIQQAHAQLKTLDVLVNNAGLAPSTTLAHTSDDLWHSILNTNLSSAFYATRAAWPFMETQFHTTGTGGTIVNISSMAARDPFPGLGPYACAKLALTMLTLVTAREGAPVNIRALCLAPAAVDTPMFRNLVGGAPKPGTTLTPEDVAATIDAALTDSLRYASGETIYLHHGPA